jgi:hypothetical protein
MQVNGTWSERHRAFLLSWNDLPVFLDRSWAPDAGAPACTALTSSAHGKQPQHAFQHAKHNHRRHDGTQASKQASERLLPGTHRASVVRAVHPQGSWALQQAAQGSS